MVIKYEDNTYQSQSSTDRESNKNSGKKEKVYQQRTNVTHVLTDTDFMKSMVFKSSHVFKLNCRKKEEDDMVQILLICPDNQDAGASKAPLVVAETRLPIDGIVSQNSKTLTLMMSSKLNEEVNDNVGEIKLKISFFKDKHFKTRELS